MEQDQTANLDIGLEQVSQFLQANPQFFEQHIDLLTHMYLPSPHGNGTVSLAERQQIAQRDKIRVLEARLADFIKFGQENEATSEKVHRLSLGLLASQQLDILAHLLMQTLQEDFAVMHAKLRLWGKPKETPASAQDLFASIDPELQQWIESLSEPYCGNAQDIHLHGLFADIENLQSFALIPLRHEQTFGVLALASEDSERFYSGMGTVFLKRIGELLSASLLRYV
jgi:uncharacterized protein